MKLCPPCKHRTESQSGQGHVQDRPSPSRAVRLLRVFLGAKTGAQFFITRSATWTAFSRRPTPSTMTLVDSDERKRNKHELASAFDTARPSPVRKRLEMRDRLDYGLRHPPCGFGTGLGDVVTDPFEIVGRIRRPSNAHQPA